METVATSTRMKLRTEFQLKNVDNYKIQELITKNKLYLDHTHTQIQMGN